MKDWCMAHPDSTFWLIFWAIFGVTASISAIADAISNRGGK